MVFSNLKKSLESTLSASPHVLPPALSKDGGKSHFILPAFFQTIVKLTEEGRDFTIVIRTFGSDLGKPARTRKRKRVNTRKRERNSILLANYANHVPPLRQAQTIS